MGQMKRFTDLYEKTVDVVQRRKQARRMAKLQKSPAFQFKKKKAALKMRNPAKLHQLARKKLIQQFTSAAHQQTSSTIVLTRHTQRVVKSELRTLPLTIPFHTLQQSDCITLQTNY